MKQNKYNYNNQTGMYRNKIHLRQRIVTQDELLQDIESFVDWGNPWAMVKTSKNDETAENGQEQTKVQKRFVIRYSKSLQAFIDAEHTSFEVIHNDVVFDVKEAVDDNDLHETITIYAEARV